MYFQLANYAANETANQPERFFSSPSGIGRAELLRTEIGGGRRRRRASKLFQILCYFGFGPKGRLGRMCNSVR